MLLQPTKLSRTGNIPALPLHCHTRIRQALRLDWRLGAELFASLLVDHDWTLNTTNWAYNSGEHALSLLGLHGYSNMCVPAQTCTVKGCHTDWVCHALSKVCQSSPSNPCFASSQA